MIQLTQQMRDLIDPALAKGTPCLVATASKDGTPNIGYKGSVMVFDDESLAYWERTLQGTQHNLDENPNVMILFRPGVLSGRLPSTKKGHYASRLWVEPYRPSWIETRSARGMR